MWCTDGPTRNKFILISVAPFHCGTSEFKLPHSHSDYGKITIVHVFTFIYQNPQPEPEQYEFMFQIKLSF